MPVLPSGTVFSCGPKQQTAHLNGATRTDADPMSRFLIILGLSILAIGLLWPWIGKLGLGRLPGDFMVQRGSVRFHFPLMTSLIVSVVLSLIVGFFSR